MKIERIATISVIVLLCIFGIVVAGQLLLGDVEQSFTPPDVDARDGTSEELAILQPTFTPIPKPNVSCPVAEAEAYLEELQMQLEDWDDLVQVAGATPRMSLPPLVRELQEARRDVQRIEHPECANYLQELIIVALESEIDSYLAFLADESDTIVSQKMQGAARTRAIVDQEIEAYRADPMAAYVESNTTAEQLEAKLGEAQPFELPEGWRNMALDDGENLIFSLPGTWQVQTDVLMANRFEVHNEDETIRLTAKALDDAYLSAIETDAGRLFSIQTELETFGLDFYSERRAETGVYALNRGYLVEYSVRYVSGGEIEQAVWVYVITPEGREVLVTMTTKRDEFAQIDYLLMEEILRSIRAAPVGGEIQPNT